MDMSVLFSVLVGKLTLYMCCLVLSSMAMLGASSQVGPMRKMMRKQMLFMQLWINGWMKEGKKGGTTFHTVLIQLLDKIHFFLLCFVLV